VLVRVVSTKVDVGWGACILGDASMSSLRYVRELDGMVHHPYFPQGSLGGHDVMHFGAWSDVSPSRVNKQGVEAAAVG
jgi:hypothetical protein